GLRRLWLIQEDLVLRPMDLRPSNALKHAGDEPLPLQLSREAITEIAGKPRRSPIKSPGEAIGSIGRTEEDALSRRRVPGYVGPESSIVKIHLAGAQHADGPYFGHKIVGERQHLLVLIGVHDDRAVNL